LLLRNEAIDFASYSPEEMQRIMSDFDQWNAQMIGKEQLIASASLQGGGGKTLRKGVVSDGPYSEAREAVAGLLLIRADDMEQAVAVAGMCPFLPRGGSVEVRQVGELEFEDAAQQIVDAHMQARLEKVGG
ncbi:MAG: YciI family protein, partial [Candidatus Promineifilaceae bacterium]|nr:YciI family protein [Candidatus Promineifilaceae bacterium]